jgi:microcystin-dependent protein
VRNAESTTITTGTCVYLFGATGDHATVKRADNNNDSTSSKTIGVAGANITASNNGPVITRGYVDGIDLSVGYTAGDILWLGENGAFTTTKPTAPDHLVFIGVVVRATNNGIIYVATQNGYELDELHNVSLPSPNSGEFLKYNGSLWVADAIDLGTDTTGNYMSGISGTSPVSVAHTPSEGSSATVSLDSAYGDTQNPYGSKTANTFLAAPNGSSGVPSFRSIVAADIPTLNQDTTGNAATVTTNANLTGDVTSVGNATTIGANKVTRSMLAVTEQLPVGTILMWAGGSTTTATYTNSDVPSGFLLCDGQEVLRTGTYANLFSAINVRYGSGDGSTTFNLPNLIAFAPVGSKQANALTNSIRGNPNAVASGYTTTGATTTTAHHSHSLTGSNSTASNIALTGSNTGGSNIYITGANSNIADNQHRHTYQKPTSNYFQTDTGYSYAVSGSNSNIGLAGSNASASNIGLSGSNATASNFSAATITSGNTTAHSHTISGHAVVYIIKY